MRGKKVVRRLLSRFQYTIVLTTRISFSENSVGAVIQKDEKVSRPQLLRSGCVEVRGRNDSWFRGRPDVRNLVLPSPLGGNLPLRVETHVKSTVCLG